MMIAYRRRTLAALFIICGLTATSDSTAAPPLDKSPFINEVDTNSDGCLSHEEWTVAGAPESSYQGLKDANGCARFTNNPPPPGLDANSDGKMTLQEIKEFDKRVQAAKAAAILAAAGPSATEASVAPAAPPMGPPPRPAARGPSLAVADEAAHAALAACAVKGYIVSVSIVDSAGILKVLLAGDGAFDMAIRSSTRKAVTANAFKMPTSQVGEQIKSDPNFAARAAADPVYISWAGGIPMRIGSDVIGAIGVGGAHLSADDESCAVAGLEKVQSRLK